MIRMMRVLLFFPVLLLLAACGGADDTVTETEPPAAGIEHPTGATDVVLQLTLTGGFVPVEYNLRRVPAVTIYGDGRVIAEGAVPAIFPGPAIFPLTEGRIDEAAIQDLLGAIDEAGLNAGAIDFGQPPIADAPSTVLQLTTGTTTLVHSANALDIAAGQGLTPEQVDARKRLAAVVAKVQQVAMAAATAPYVAESLSAWVGPYQGEPATDPPVVWPLKVPITSGVDPNGFGFACIAVAGADVAALTELAAASANEASQWVAADDTNATFRVVIRPGLPHEKPCTVS
jgi:hypothetical protein